MPVFHLVLFGKWFALKQSTCFERCEWAKTLNLCGHSLCHCTYWLTEYSPFCPAFFALPLGYCLLCSHLPLFTISCLLFFCPPLSTRQPRGGLWGRCWVQSEVLLKNGSPNSRYNPPPLSSALRHDSYHWNAHLEVISGWALFPQRKPHVWVLRLW